MRAMIYRKGISIGVVCALCTISSFTSAQSLNEVLQSKVALEEIMNTVDQYYQNLQSQGIDRMPGEPRYKHWKRYEWYMSGRLGPDGEFVNINSRLNISNPVPGNFWGI